MALWNLCASYLWSIPVTWRTSRGHVGSLWLRDAEGKFELPELLNASSFDWIKLNLNETAYYRVNYMQSNWRALVNAIRRQHTVKPYFHYGCALRCVALRSERNRNTIGVFLSLAVQRRATNAQP